VTRYDDPIRDRWLRGLAERLRAGAAPPRFSDQQIDRLFEYLDQHPLLRGTEDESTIRSALAPLWLRGGPSLRKARRDLRAGLDAGSRCPCCDKFAKRYKRRLGGAIARSLAWLVLASDRSIRAGDGDGWVDVPETGPRWVVRGQPHPKLALWRFAERREVEDDSPTRSSGRWRPTALGRSFVRGEIDAPAWVFEYLSEVESVSSERVRFEEVLDVAFDYRALMEDR